MRRELSKTTVFLRIEGDGIVAERVRRMYGARLRMMRLYIFDDLDRILRKAVIPDQMVLFQIIYDCPIDRDDIRIRFYLIQEPADVHGRPARRNGEDAAFFLEEPDGFLVLR